MIGTFLLNACTDVTSCITKHLDFCIIDREHGRVGFEKAGNLMASIDDSCLKFIRVSHCNRLEIQRVLELNPDGILVPQIQSVDEALAAVSYCFFPPKGTRGVSPYTRPFNFHHESFLDKRERINDGLKLGLLIEGIEGVRSTAGILEKVGDAIDFLYFGLFDFASSQGLDPSWGNKELITVLEEVIDLAKQHGVKIGTISTNKREIKDLANVGVEYIVFQNDLGVIFEAFNDLSLAVSK